MQVIVAACLAFSLSGCASLHERRETSESGPSYHVQVSGEAVVDQMLSVPQAGTTVGEAIDACLQGKPAENAFVIATQGSRRLIFPYAAVASGRASDVFLRPADRVIVTNGIPASRSPDRPIDVIIGGLSPQRGQKTLFPDPVNQQFACFDMLQQLGVINEADERVGAARAAELLRITRANGDVWLLPLDSDAMMEVHVGHGDRLELTAFALAPEVIQGNARARARMIVEREQNRRLTDARKRRDFGRRIQQATPGSVTFIGKTVGAVGRTVMGAIP